VAVERNVEVVVARDCGDLPASTLVVSTAVLVLVSTASCPTRLAVSVVLVDSDWAAAAGTGLLPACRGFWDVVLEWRADSEDGVDESVPSSSELGTKADGSSKVVVSALADGLELV
jgi:hypothetical protein